MQVRITRTIKTKNYNIKNVIDLLLPFNGSMIFLEERMPIMFNEENFLWEDMFDHCRQFRLENSIPDEDFLIVLTDLKNRANWFSGFAFSNELTVFIQTTEWENYIYCEPQLPVAYEVVANIFQAKLYQKFGAETLKRTHSEPIGCMNDMCSWKPDISFKLRTADICNDCLTLLNEVVSEKELKQGVEIFEFLRKKMLFNSKLQKPLSFEESLPFCIAITKRKLSTTLEAFRKLLMLIDHFDSIIRTSVLMIATLIKNSEEIKAFLFTQNLHNHPSLGHWVDALSILTNENSIFFKELHLSNDFRAKVSRVIQIANDNKIIYIRNEKRGHGYIDCQDSGYKQIYYECISAIEEMEKLLAPLFHRFKYYHVINLKKNETGNFVISVHDLSGSNPAFIEREVTVKFNHIDEIPIENKVYLVSPDEFKWISLDPYFKYTECNLCHHNRFLVYDGAYMLDPYIGHRFERSIDRG